ncbi:MAG: ABC transporter ATP-binding protein [Gammaproteobacteria bacterium]
MPERGALRVEALSAGYRAGRPVVSDLDVTVGEGEVVTVIGPNGAGKSTLIKAIAGLAHVEGGRIEYLDTNLVDIAPHRMAQFGVAYVPQTANVFQTLSVRRNLMLAARRTAEMGNSRLGGKHRVEAMFALFGGLREKHKSPAGNLSGGQRQMLAIAMALIAQPTLVLMDEPTAGLAPRAAEEVLALIRDIGSDGAAVLLVEQNARAALRISDRAYVLANGRNQLDGPAANLLADPAVGEIYLGVRPRAGA